jgi:hypothetical protein
VALVTLLDRVPLAGVVTIDVRVPSAPVLTRGTATTNVSSASGG